MTAEGNAEGSEDLFRLRKKIVRNIVTSICLLSLPVFAQIPDTSNLPIRSLHTKNGEPFIRLASEVIRPKVFQVREGDGISLPKPIFSPSPGTQKKHAVRTIRALLSWEW